MSTLQAQLKQQLQHNRANVLPRTKPSLLFDQKQAGDIDRDSLFALGKNGLAELIRQDPARFESFDATLFSESLKNLDRTLQNKEDNAKLDDIIHTFLRSLSPYFLQQCALKALEWLLRRFRINEFNVEAIIECILPYHDSRQFGQMLSLLIIDQDSRWGFLKTVQKTSVPIDRSTLVQRCIMDRSVLDFICGMVLRSITYKIPNRTLYSFFTAISLQYLQALKTVNDGNTRMLLTTVLEITTFDFDEANPLSLDVYAAAYMIIGQIAAKTPLDTEVLLSIISVLAMNQAAALEYPSILCLLTICETQPSLPPLPESALQSIASLGSLLEYLAKIRKVHRADKFVMYLLKALVLSKNESNYKLVASILLQETFPLALVGDLFRLVCEIYLSDASIQQHTGRIAGILHSKYAQEFDRLIEAIFSELPSRDTPEGAEKHAALFRFLSESIKGTIHKSISESTTLFFSLQHSESKARLLAVNHVKSLIRAEADVDVLPEYIREAVMDRLRDDAHDVVAACLAIPHLELFSAQDHFVDSLVYITTNRHSGHGLNRIAALKKLHAIYGGKKTAGDVPDHVLVAVLSSLLFTRVNASVAEYVVEVATKPSSLVHRFIKPSSMVKSKTSGTHEALDHITTITSDAASKDSEVLDFYINGLGSEDPYLRILSALVLAKYISVPQNAKAHNLGKLVPVMLNAIVARIAQDPSSKGAWTIAKGARVFPAELTSLIEGATRADIAANKSIELRVYSYLLNTLLVNLERPSGKSVAWLDPTQSDNEVKEYKEIIGHVFASLATHTSAPICVDGIKILFSAHLHTDTLEFLCSIWTLGENESYSSLRVAALEVAALFINSSTESGSKPRDYQILIPSLLVPLLSPARAIRESATLCLEAVKQAYQKALPTASPKGKSSIPIFAYDEFYGQSSKKVQYLTAEAGRQFVSNILLCSNEIRTDASFLQHHMKDLLFKDRNRCQEDLLCFILSSTLAFNLPFPQARLLSTLSLIDTPVKSKMLHPLLDSMLRKKRTETVGVYEQELLRLIIQCYTPAATAALFSSQSKYLRLFCHLISPDPVVSGVPASPAVVQELAISQIGAQWFQAAPALSQYLIFESLVNLCTAAAGDLLARVKDCLCALTVSSELVAAQLSQCQQGLAHDDERAESKRQRVGSSAHNDQHLYKLSSLLELLETNLQVTSKHHLVTPLFDVLGLIINTQVPDSPVSMEYIKQLILSSLLSIVESNKEPGVITDDTLRVDLIVQCIRVTENPQTHNASLLLLASIATIYPDNVLANVMPVFTFMGANVLRQDDNYSFHVIQQTLETIIPPLVDKFRTQAGDNSRKLIQDIKPVVKVFIDALFHIPKHRRLRLFTVLVSTLGSDQFLSTISALLVEKTISKRSTVTSAAEVAGLPEFNLSVLHYFESRTQVKAMDQLIQTLIELPDSKLDNEVEHPLFGVQSHSERELRYFKLSCVDLIVQLLGSKPFLSKLLSLSEEARTRLEDSHLGLIEQLLKLMSHVNTSKEAAEKSQEHNTIKYCKAISKKLHDALGKVNALLSLPVFINVISALLNNSDMLVRRRSIVLLNQKLTAIQHEITKDEVQLFEKVIEDLKRIIGGVDAAATEDALINKQMALICLGTMVNSMAVFDSDTFAGIMPILVGKGALGHSSPQVMASAMICIAAFCKELGPRTVPFLPKLMQPIVAVFGACIEATGGRVGEGANGALLLTVVSSLEAIIAVVPQFVGSYVPQILKCALHPLMQRADIDSPDGKKLVEKNKDLLGTLAEKVAARTLVPAILARLAPVLNDGRNSILALFDFAANMTRHMPKNDIYAFQSDLFKFFVGAFDYRRGFSDRVKPEDVDAVEASMISSFLQLVMKMNESLFKPMFLKLVDWCTSRVLEQNGMSKKEIHCRQLFFYRLLDNLLGRLKSIIVPYFGYVIDNCILQLNHFVKAEASDPLWTYILMSIHKCLLFDNDGFVDNDKFDKLLAPLCNQIDNINGHGDEYMVKMTTYLVPCLGQLAVTCAKESNWKPLNNKILMKSRSESPEIRTVSLRVVSEFYSRIGEEFLVLLPETIPFLAELMEDDDEGVEKLCQEVCAQIQHYLGEPIQQYFNQ
ncbi:uncharacterized protein BJ171DRAFT_626821 [Polychytrium aggregatum]|uniref:uncharacterized protein n=1 Tax=Polychytrium aggregatum TaxID=110093 RepID=UPI0022FDE5AE|nr:uncharacterized protein BJ171DRAFT_626821 [Polychytrium aggregatum]KAI9208838.1 hypothetical protein BJ171DRAFT_626821 [Polychytrium aggregatum]